MRSSIDSKLRWIVPSGKLPLVPARSRRYIALQPARRLVCLASRRPRPSLSRRSRKAHYIKQIRMGLCSVRCQKFIIQALVGAYRWLHGEIHMINDLVIRISADTTSAEAPHASQSPGPVDRFGIGTVIRQYDAYAKPPRIARSFETPAPKGSK